MISVYVVVDWVTYIRSPESAGQVVSHSEAMNHLA
jgi:hypothetical protein